jgi:hypothetical protein
MARHAVGWARERHPNPPVLARTTLDNIGSQRTAASAGLVRRQDLEGVDPNGVYEVILVSHWRSDVAQSPSRGAAGPPRPPSRRRWDC